jgi:hypothetical protein
MSFGRLYSTTWFGDTNSDLINGWGIVYPFDSDLSVFTADDINTSADNTFYTSDKTVY